MKYASILRVTGLLLGLTSTSHALHPVQGWYAGLMLGITAQPDTNFTFTAPILGDTRNASLSHVILGNVGGQVGYRCGKFRVEFESFYNNNTYSSINFDNLTIPYSNTATGLTMQGSSQMGVGIFNGYIDFYDAFKTNSPESSRVVPFIGAGYGYAYTQNNIEFFYSGTKIDGTNVREHTSGGIAQAIAGVNYFMDDFTTLGIDARYYRTLNRSYFLNAYTQVFALNLVFNGALDAG